MSSQVIIYPEIDKHPVLTYLLQV